MYLSQMNLVNCVVDNINILLCLASVIKAYTNFNYVHLFETLDFTDI